MRTADQWPLWPGLTLVMWRPQTSDWSIDPILASDWSIDPMLASDWSIGDQATPPA